MGDIPLKKLGKLAPVHDYRTLKLSNYLTPALPSIPDSFSWVDFDRIPKWGEMGNDRFGDCVLAMMAHLIMGWTAAAGDLFIPSDEEVLQAYAAITGFNPITGAGDNGTNELDALKYMAKTGIAGHKIGAFVSVNLQNPEELKAAIWLFGGTANGVGLPLSAAGEPNWDYPPDDSNKRDPTPGSWGGHGIPTMAYYGDNFDVITWGAPMKVNSSFYYNYMDEAYAIISPDFVNGTKPAPNGFNMDQLLADLESVTA
jgi:hypothetical protein